MAKSRLPVTPLALLCKVSRYLVIGPSSHRTNVEHMVLTCIIISHVRLNSSLETY